MSVQSKNLLSAKTSVIALLVLMVVVMVTSLNLVRRAEAQNPPSTLKPITYAPMQFVAYPTTGIYNSVLTMYLPAVQNVGTQFRVEAISDGATVNLAIPTGAEGDAIVYAYFLVVNGTTWLYLENAIDGSFHRTRAGTNGDSSYVTIRVHPATNAGGKDILPIATSITNYGSEYNYYEDGTSDLNFYSYPLVPGA